MILDQLEAVAKAHGRAILDLAWPPHCPRCEERAARPHTQFCESCWARLRPLEDAEVDGLVAAFVVDALFLDILAAGKYRRARMVVERLTSLAAARLASRLPEGVLVPVPLTSTRRRERGFNQSEIFANALASAAGRPVEREWIRRRRGGAPLAGRPRSERREAIDGAFEATSRFPGASAPPLVLLDDVYTTGSTLGDCVRAVRAAEGTVAGLAVLGRAFASRDRNSSGASRAIERL